ncbi:MAG: hypothetical protein KF723_21430 [Rhizobiaceae bacterium]|nr:hypothetical protein [Rhizobiaceae bacterium]
MLVVLGRVRPIAIHMPPPEFAVLCELCRYGHAIVTNARASQPSALVYPKLSIKGQPKDTMPVRRLFSGAGDGQRAVPLDIASDYSAANVFFEPDPVAKKDARAVAMRHAERLALEVNGMAFDAGPYLRNLEALFALIDSEAANASGA